MRRALEKSSESDRFKLRILDPACGDGAFVIPVLDWIADHLRISSDDVARRRQIVDDHVFGTDADPAAIAILRRRVAAWIDPKGLSTEEKTVTECDPALARNFVCGNALTGPGWQSPVSPLANSPKRTPDRKGAVFTARTTGTLADVRIDWPEAFPQVAGEGGFDLVIGNPPYRRERDSKREFDLIAASPLGQRWRTARMDLWYYFLHRGLDLLRPGGRLSFIVSSYWTGATSAASLRRRLAAESTMEQIVQLGSSRLFQDVSGRHLIFRTRKKAGLVGVSKEPAVEATAVEPCSSEAACDVWDLSSVTLETLRELMERNEPMPPVRSDDARAATHSITTRSVRQDELWSGDRLLAQTTVLNAVETCPTVPLGEVFEVRQGIAENPPCVTKSAARLLQNNSLAGQGVFVVSREEVAALNLGAQEVALLRPYYALSTVGRFQVRQEPSHQLLYLTRQTAPRLDALPEISRHLTRFRPLLERRREVLSGQIAWWHLHWPRQERLFTEPRILCMQMGHQPRFAYAWHPTFVGFSMHVIVERPERADAALKDSSATDPAASSFNRLSLPALAAILNSARASRWFDQHAKRRGAQLDISGTVLKRFPLPRRRSWTIEATLDHLARNWTGSAESESQLNSAVESLYKE